MNILTHPRPYVGLVVAAAYLGIDERTVRARVDDGQIRGYRDGKAWRIPVAELQRYDSLRKQFSEARRSTSNS